MGIIILNTIKIEVQENLYTIIQQCEILNIIIPRFCYHEKLSIAGNCRICLIEVNNSFKLVVACATMVLKNMIINTINDTVKNSRENIIEFLLINHPLDCPICDQGGECDLQDQTLLYGRDRSRFSEIKRSVLDKNFSSFIKTIMTRCIHCTRCIRYFNEIIGYPVIGTIGRGSKMEITNYIYSKDYTELSGNVIDICPVGALTSKPFSFSARPWELIHLETIDLLDSYCSAIRINIKDDEVMRILPSVINNRNSYWITNKIRFAYDSIRIQRIYSPKIKNLEINCLVDVSWKKVFKYIKYNFYRFIKTKNYANHFYAYSGKFIDLESLLLFKLFFRALDICNINIDMYNENDFYKSYLLNTTALISIEDTQLFILYGLNTKLENSMLNLQLRKISLENSNEVLLVYIGNKLNLNYSIIHIGLTMGCLLEIYYGAIFINHYLVKFSNSIFISGKDACNYDFNTLSLIENLNKYLDKNIDFQYNNLFSGIVSILDLNIMSKVYSKLSDRKYNLPKIIYFCGYENFEYFNILYTNIFIIYQGHHYDDLAKKANVLIPSPTFIEKKGIFMNCDGLYHHTNSIWGYEHKFKEDYSILSGLFDYIISDNILFKKYTYLKQNINNINSLKLVPFRYYNYNNIYLIKEYSNTLLKLFPFKHQFIEDVIFITSCRNFFTMDVFCKNSITIVKHLHTIKNFSNF